MNKIALVTGAGSGIGKAVSLTLMREGYSLVLAGRRAEALEEVAAVGEKLGAEILAVPTDVGDPEAVENLFAKTKERFGRLDLLFNNAGIGTRGTLLEDLSH
ncbi:MAG: SDR family NAD(P)-dependent oxidoreductase, partial [Rhodospirillales bacterium]|nr:SDR family NAD(P)-dependent oxidoreductase [Rhodospirillales bacterium]